MTDLRVELRCACVQSNFGALDIELTDEEMQKLSSLEFQKRLVDGSMVRCFAGAQQACLPLEYMQDPPGCRCIMPVC